jgi:hypothetical protein
MQAEKSNNSINYFTLCFLIVAIYGFCLLFPRSAGFPIVVKELKGAGI